MAKKTDGSKFIAISIERETYMKLKKLQYEDLQKTGNVKGLSSVISSLVK